MAVVNRAVLARQIEPGLNALFGLEHKKYPEEWRKIFSVETSEKAFEEDVMQSGMNGAVVKGEGAGVTYDSIGETWVARYNHETIALAGAITEEAIEDNLYVSVGNRIIKALARSMAHTKNVRGATIINDGYGAFDSGDGVDLFHTAHPLANGQTVGNTPAAQTDLSETALEAACIAIANFVDERGLAVRVLPRRLIIPVDLTFEAERILKSSSRVATADNDLNAIRTTGMFPEGWEVNHYVTDIDGWTILTDCPDGAKMFQRRAMKQQMEPDFETGNLRYKCSERYSFGVSDWRAFYGSSGA